MGAVKIWDALDTQMSRDSTGDESSSRILYSSLTVDTSLPLHLMKPRVIDLCKDLFKNWSNLDDSLFFVEIVSGGITNLLLKVTVKEGNDSEVSVTVRLYGPNTEIVINRERELEAIKYLSAAGFGAKLRAVFGNGMVQDFIYARTLTPSDMREPKLGAAIAKELQKFHQVEIPGSKEPQLWKDVFKFFEKASTLIFDDIAKQKIYEKISFEEVRHEIVELKELTDRLDSPVVFSHNDLLSGNIMLDEQDKLYLIDFEYGSYNYRGHDLGNHFAEYAGYDCDYSLYPRKGEQYHFLRHYLQRDRPNEVSERDLEVLYVEANMYMLAAHLYWALWALIQAKCISQAEYFLISIDFDYLGYFFLRYNKYKNQRAKCISQAESFLSRYRKD